MTRRAGPPQTATRTVSRAAIGCFVAAVCVAAVAGVVAGVWWWASY